MNGGGHFQNQSLGKGLRVLELLCEHREMSVSDVARELGLNRATSHRYLSTLRELGYVEMTASSHFRLTLKIMELGMKLAERFEIRRIARPHMVELAAEFKETVNLGHWDGKGMVLIDKVESDEHLRLNSPIGLSLPAYCTASGKAILSFMPREEVELYLRMTKLDLIGPNTITTPEGLRRELEITRERGYAIEDDEHTVGLRCVGAPIFDHRGIPAYAMAVAGPSGRFTSERVEEIQYFLRRHCRAVSKLMGASVGAPQTAG